MPKTHRAATAQNDDQKINAEMVAKTYTDENGNPTPAVSVKSGFEHVLKAMDADQEMSVRITLPGRVWMILN